MSNPWLNNSRWMKNKNGNNGSRDLSEKSDSESEMSNNGNGEYEGVNGKKMNNLMKELQGWKNKCVRMEEGFRMDKEKWKKLFVAKQAELNRMKDTLEKMGEELKQIQVEREKLEGKSNRLDRLIKELEKLGMTEFVNEFDNHNHTHTQAPSVDDGSRDSEGGCSVSDSEDTDKLMDVGMDGKGKVREMKPQAEVSLTSLSLCQNNKISQRNNTDRKDMDGLMDVGMEVKGKLREMKPQSEIVFTSVSEKDKMPPGNNNNILEGTQRRPHCTITTPSNNRAGERMLKQGFEDFDRWMSVDPVRKLRSASIRHSKIDRIQPSNSMLEGARRRSHCIITIPAGDRGVKTQGEGFQDMKEQDKGGEDAELQVVVPEEVEIQPVQMRCKRQDGKQWRCSFPALPGRALCDKHYTQQQSSKNRKGESEWGNAQKPKKGMSNISEGKQSLSIVAKLQQGNMKKCRSEDEEEDLSDSEDEPPKKKKKSRFRDQEEEDPDYSPTMRRKQKYEKLELLANEFMALSAGHENFRKGTCSDLGNDHVTTGRGRWEQKDLVSRDGQMKLSTQVLFASFDQRSERAAGESACSALVAVIADWLHKNKNSVPTKALFDNLIRDGSLEWRNLCQIQAYKHRFPDGHFDLETVLDAKVCPLSLAPDKSFVGFFQPEKMGDSFEFLKDSMSFDNIWEEITNGAHGIEAENCGPKIYIVIWNDHFFLLKVEKEAYYIIDTLGERLFEGCNQAYILKFDNNTTVHQLTEEEKSSTTTQSASLEISKSNGNKLQQGNAKIRNASPVEIADKNDVKGKLICKGKESCKEFIKGFWAALTLRELEIDIKRGSLGGIQPYQRLQIEFHFTVGSSSTSMELITGKPSNYITLAK